MALQVAFHRLAATEARAAEAWYASRSVEVAERFRAAVLDAAQRIADDVGTHPVGESRFRYVRAGRFPYRLIYCLESESVWPGLSPYRTFAGVLATGDDENKESLIAADRLSTPGRTRTCNLRIRSPLLYPIELRAL